MADTDHLALTALLLSASTALTEAIDAGVHEAGFTDLRPAHGFAFTRLAPHGATTAQLAAHLGMTKQAAAQLVDELHRNGYVTRRPHPDDARARLVELTDRGRAATRAAEAAAARAAAAWQERIGPDRMARLRADLAALAAPGRIRPAW
ncbi:MarR family winged helix-turn-helix transcriptional regulator [Streptomonospora wellingtoniae]|uniref:MarR family transcriptional regulator n=1 Tax=Streptomonospora wellingtoniae TaxID=3075544 RepID=A0ABU2KTL5_9ACTN|nr:MarR family transcriptional regulator [Streptomonospora sp. DSM 45055]MDT0302631.1 MarR family transcriptional regulator [Streptomonospora sp. DSM 45055]